MRDEVRAGRREAAGNRGARCSLRGEGTSADLGMAWGGAHPKHRTHAIGLAVSAAPAAIAVVVAAGASRLPPPQD